MKNILSFGFYYVKSRLYNKLYTPDTWPVNYAGKPQLSIQEGNDYIRELLQGDKPFMVGRYGAGELCIAKVTIAKNFGLVKNYRESDVSAICNNAGFFPRDTDLIYEYGNFVLKKSKNADLLGAFYSPAEEYIIKNYTPGTKVVRLRGLEPYYAENGWTTALEGKKVLVIHPFEETIKSQFPKRELLFPKTKLMPDFELKTLKAVQTIAGEKDSRFSNWFEALEYMHDSAMKIDFDVAIIGCGAYGFPLAALLKESGKSAIHLGGATQYLFGIKSKRAESESPFIASLFNEHWVRPSADEKPQNANSVEGGCYW